MIINDFFLAPQNYMPLARKGLTKNQKRLTNHKLLVVSTPRTTSCTSKRPNLFVLYFIDISHFSQFHVFRRKKSDIYFVVINIVCNFATVVTVTDVTKNEVYEILW